MFRGHKCLQLLCQVLLAHDGICSTFAKLDADGIQSYGCSERVVSARCPQAIELLLTGCQLQLQRAQPLFER